MKVVVILGSPRKKGTSTRIALSFAEEAEKRGAQVKTHSLNKMNYKGCQGCDSCKTRSEACVLKDDLTEVLGDLADSDLAVLATPVYYWDVSGQFKCFIDRTWSFVKPDYMSNPAPSRLAPGKKAVLITTQGDVEAKHRDVAEKYESFLAWYGFETHVIRGVELSMDPDADVAPYAARARELAQALIS